VKQLAADTNDSFKLLFSDHGGLILLLRARIQMLCRWNSPSVELGENMTSLRIPDPRLC
jgi:hypothetical protein